MRGTGRIVAGLGVSFAVLAPGHADAGWGTAHTLGRHAASALRIVANDRGDVIALWADSRGGVVTRSAVRGGRFGTARRIPHSDFQTYPADIDLAIDDRGDAVTAWEDTVDDPNSTDPSGCECAIRVIAATKPAGRGWRRARVMSQPHTESFVGGIAVAPAGAWVTWDEAGAPIHARGTDSAFRFRHALRMGGLFGDESLVSIVPRGVLFQWWQEDANYRDSIVGRLRTPDGQLRRRHTFAQGELYNGLQIATAANGSQAALWHNDSDEGPVKLAVRRPGQRFGHVRRVGHPHDLARTDLAMAPSGVASMVMTSSPEFSSKHRRVIVATAAPGAPFDAPRKLRAFSESEPRTAIGSDGTAAASWLAVDDRSVQVTVRRGNRGFRRPKTLARTKPVGPPGCLESPSVFCPLPDIAVGARRAYAVWIDGSRVRLARYQR